MWQEIHSFIMIGDQVTVATFDELCKRRGFDEDMTEYLRRMLICVGIGKHLF